MVQADIEWGRHNRVKALTKHTIAVWTDHIVTNTHTLRAVDALVRITQDEAMLHVKFVIVIVTRLTIMEAVISQAMFDTVLLQITLPSRGTSAL